MATKVNRGCVPGLSICLLLLFHWRLAASADYDVEETLKNLLACQGRVLRQLDVLCNEQNQDVNVVRQRFDDCLEEKFSPTNFALNDIQNNSAYVDVVEDVSVVCSSITCVREKVPEEEIEITEGNCQWMMVQRMDALYSLTAELSALIYSAAFYGTYAVLISYLLVKGRCNVSFCVEMSLIFLFGFIAERCNSFFMENLFGASSATVRMTERWCKNFTILAAAIHFTRSALLEKKKISRKSTSNSSVDRTASVGRSCGGTDVSSDLSSEKTESAAGVARTPSEGAAASNVFSDLLAVFMNFMDCVFIEKKPLEEKSKDEQQTRSNPRISVTSPGTQTVISPEENVVRKATPGFEILNNSNLSFSTSADRLSRQEKERLSVSTTVNRGSVDQLYSPDGQLARTLESTRKTSASDDELQKMSSRAKGNNCFAETETMSCVDVIPGNRCHLDKSSESLEASDLDTSRSSYQEYVEKFVEGINDELIPTDPEDVSFSVVDESDESESETDEENQEVSDHEIEDLQLDQTAHSEGLQDTSLERSQRLSHSRVDSTMSTWGKTALLSELEGVEDIAMTTDAPPDSQDS